MFSVENYEDTTVISAVDLSRINFRNIENLRHQFLKLLHKPCRKIILDFEEVTFIDSTSFEVLEQMHGVAFENKVEIEFVNVHDELRELFDLIPFASKYSIGKARVPEIAV